MDPIARNPSLQPVQTYRVMVSWEPRPQEPRGLAKQLVAAIDWLRSVPACAAEWSAMVGSTRIACTNEEKVARALSSAPQPPFTVPPERYRQTFYLGSPRKWRAKLVKSAGASRPLRGAQLPNHLELCVRADLSVEELRQLLIGLVAVYRPVWGLVGTQGYPVSSLSNDTPMVGWLTYLSSALGTAPELPAPAVVTDIPRFGSIVQAFPERLDADDPSHRDRLTDLNSELEARGKLRPFAVANEG